MISRFNKSIAVALSIVLFFGNISFADNDGETNKEKKYYYHDVYNTGKDNGYSGYHEIDDDDMHYGWELGKFQLSGFVDKTVDDNGNIIFFKNYDTKMSLDFILEQNIEELNGNDSMFICNDKNGYDEEFNIPKGDIEHGCLIVTKTDHENITTRPIFYGDYLVGVEKDMSTDILLLEEGDYTVVLDYEIRHDRVHVPVVGWDIAPEYANYRIKFSFSVRNSNCMVFIRDAETKSELPEKAIAENGFFLDLANSHYLSIFIIRKQIAANGYSLVEDTRFNAMISEGTIIDKEGLYEITVKNPANNLETQKRVYVGKDPIMKAYIVSGYSLEEIQEFISNGATINEAGEIIMPLPTATPSPEPTPEPTESPTPSPVPTNTPTMEPTQPAQSESQINTSIPAQQDAGGIDIQMLVVTISVFLVFVIGFILMRLRRNRRMIEDEERQKLIEQNGQENNDDHQESKDMIASDEEKKE